ncbi:glycerate kinase [Streptomyces oceani]|uniref:Glycerate kinase n=1 Tax=Streptomyces oceani TaxID=1075402 RepID=A0A1E7KCM7_9ACTN|nr:glycerate kinase [Streptomyces oceani]OEV01683.1 glycerate kinase [Streptomyces oceani]
MDERARWGPSAAAIAEGIRRVVPAAELDLVPLVDGGEGTARSLAAATGGSLTFRTATGPVGDPVRTHFALLDERDGSDAAHAGTDADPPQAGDWTSARGGVRTAVVEMAAVAGLSLVPADRRDPCATTTHGVGELISAALDAGARRLLIGCGDSGTSDGGAGALQALGARLLDRHGRELPRGGAALGRLDRIDVAGLDPRLWDTEILVACNPYNVLAGERGVARVFGPQKGAGPAQVARLEHALERWADILARDVPEQKGRDTGAPRITRTPVDDTDAVRQRAAGLKQDPGTGASGGLGAGLAALGARLLPRFEVLLDHLDLDARLEAAHLVITAEGGLDRQTVRGKVPAEVARRAQALGKPVLALAGTLGEGAHTVRESGVDAYSSILPAPVGLAEALDRGAEYLADAAEHAVRMVLLGTRLTSRAGMPDPASSGPASSGPVPRVRVDALAGRATG